MVGDTAEQVLCGEYTDEMTALVENRNGVDPFLQHDSSDFTEVGCRGRRDDSRGHDLGGMLAGGAARVGCCNQFRDMAKKVSIGEHSHERTMQGCDGNMVESFVSHDRPRIE